MGTGGLIFNAQFIGVLFAILRNWPMLILIYYRYIYTLCHN